MSQAVWYYMAKGWFRGTRRVGPITEKELLIRIDRGAVEPKTLLKSSKTREQWVPMSKVGPAMRRYTARHPDASGDGARATAG